MKDQIRYLGKNWRKNNMSILSGIDRMVRHHANDTWFYDNKPDAEVGKWWGTRCKEKRKLIWTRDDTIPSATQMNDFQEEEMQRGLKVALFNLHHYERIGPKLPEQALVDFEAQHTMSADANIFALQQRIW